MMILTRQSPETSAGAEPIAESGVQYIASPNWREVRNDRLASAQQTRIPEGRCGCRRRNVGGIYLPQLNSSETVSRTEVFQPNAFLRIGTDDMITVILGKS